MTDSYCKECDDSGYVSGDTVYAPGKMEIADEPEYRCEDCPKCAVCDAYLRDHRSGGLVADEWACMPAHAVELMRMEQDCDIDALIDAANLAKDMYGDVPLRDELLVSRAIKILADAVIMDGVRRKLYETDVRVDLVNHCREIVVEGGAG